MEARGCARSDARDSTGMLARVRARDEDEAAGAPGQEAARRPTSTRQLGASEARPKPVVQHRRRRRRGRAWHGCGRHG
jgi:hypothetical protein